MKMQKSVILVKQNLKINIWKIKNIVTLEIIVIIQGNIEMLRIVFVILHSFIVLHNESNYDYYFIIKELAGEFETIYLFRRKY